MRYDLVNKEKRKGVEKRSKEAENEDEVKLDELKNIIKL